MRVCNAGVSLMDHARVQNIKYFSEQDMQKQKQPILMAAVDQLTSSITGLQPQQQVTLLAGMQQMGTTPPPPADESTETERMDTGMQETESNQGDMMMGDGSGE